MNRKKHLPVLTAVTCLAASTAPSSGIVVMISDLTPSGAPIEDFFNDNFSNITEIRHGNFANFSAAASQDALNGTGAFAGQGAADVFVIGRSLSSAGYANGDSDGYNGISIPFINFTAYTARDLGNRLGWHTSSANNASSRVGDETTVTAAGAAILGLAAGDFDFFTDDPNFNGLSVGTTGFGGGEILATIGGNTLAAFWESGDAPGGVNSGQTNFPGPRLLFNLDNEPGTGNDGTNDFTGMTSEGIFALRSAIDFATPLTAVPEPSTGLLGLLGLGLLARRRRS
ncbi:MAG: PEP-CTERM sorting domain-containing protein [Akkermansiaceae bacterium]